MKISTVKFFKIFLIAALVLTVAGMTILGIFGLNKTVDYNVGYEVKVHVNQYTPTGNTIEVAKSAADGYFAEKGIKPLGYSQQEEGTGLDIIYKFNTDVTADCAGLADTVNTALEERADIKGLTASTEFSKTSASTDSSVWYIAIAVGVAAILGFIYLLISAKFAQAVAVLCSAVSSVILYVALIGLTRIPVYPSGIITGLFAFVFAEVLSVVMVSRFNEIAKLNETATPAEIAEIGANRSLLRFAFLGGLLLLASVALIALGTTYIKFVGLQLLVADIVALSASFGFTPVVFAAIKKSNSK